MGLILGVIIGSGAIGVGLTAAGANGSTIVSFSGTVTVSAPPASNFAGSAGGDGWAVAMTPTAVYNVFHHQSTVQVACHLQADATPCAGYPKTVTDGGDNFAAASQPGLYMDQNTQKLYLYTTNTTTNTAGVLCIDTTSSASNPDCGFTPLGAPGDANINLTGGFGSTSDPVLVGTNWYSFDFQSATFSGTQDQLMCFNVASDSACASQPYAVAIDGTSVTDAGYPNPDVVAIGTEVIIPINTNVGPTLSCFNTQTDTSCGGSFPELLTLNYPSEAGGAFPSLTSTGAVTGFCLPDGTDPCFDLTGAPVATPANLATAVTQTSEWDGPSLTIGARDYLADGNTEQVLCFDWSTDAACGGTLFPKQLSQISLMYTVNPDPQRPTCIWVNADGGADQIQNFDAYTGGPCESGSTRVLSSNIVSSLPECLPTSYTSLQVLSPPPSAYTGGTVTFDDFDGNQLSVPTANLDSTGSVDLTSLDLTNDSPLPQFVITLPGASSSAVEVELTWTGADLAECGASVPPSPPAPTPNPPAPGHNAIGYRLQGHDGGVFDFGQSQFYGSLPQSQTTGLVGSPIEATANTYDNGGYWLASASGGVFTYGDANFFGSLANTKLVAPIVGIAGTKDMGGYWMAAADGGVFAFGDAPFYGSLGGLKLNAPIVGLAATPDGKGYWLVAADGGVFAFGDAAFYGSLGGQKLNAPIVGIASSVDGQGYWLVAADGGVFAFGDAPFTGSAANFTLNQPVVAIVPTPDGAGYWLTSSDGGVFAFGDAPFLGSAVTIKLNQTITSASS
jgi:hypothetical protein